MFSVVAALIYIPVAVDERSLFSTASPAFIICRLSDDAILAGERWYCLHYSNNYGFCASCHVPVGHLYVFFGEMSV